MGDTGSNESSGWVMLHAREVTRYQYRLAIAKHLAIVASHLCIDGPVALQLASHANRTAHDRPF